MLCRREAGCCPCPRTQDAAPEGGGACAGAECEDRLSELWAAVEEWQLGCEPPATGHAQEVTVASAASGTWVEWGPGCWVATQLALRAVESAVPRLASWLSGHDTVESASFDCERPAARCGVASSAKLRLRGWAVCVIECALSENSQLAASLVPLVCRRYVLNVSLHPSNCAQDAHLNCKPLRKCTVRAQQTFGNGECCVALDRR